MDKLRTAVIGDSESIKGFAAVGLEIYPVDEPEAAPSVFRKLAERGDCGIIFYTEELSEVLAHETARISEQMLPAAIPIPGVKGNSGFGVKRLSGFVEKAVGSDIIFNQ